MESGIRITLIANAGVFIEYDGYRFLVDAIHQEKDHPFSVVRPEKLKDLIEGSGSYKDVEYILYTHCHSDHFSRRHTEAYLKNNRIEALFMPRTCRKGVDPGDDSCTDWDDRAVMLIGENGERKTHRLAVDLAIHAFQTDHLGEEYREDVHFCYVLSLGSANLLITGDADYHREVFEKALSGMSIDAVLVNPIFFNNKKGRTIISEVMKPREVIIYHIPFEEDDVYKIRKMTERDMKKHAQMNCIVTSLTEEGQSIHVEIEK